MRQVVRVARGITSEREHEIDLSAIERDEKEFLREMKRFPVGIMMTCEREGGEK